MKYYLGLDMGTTGVKAALFTAEGVMAGGGLAEYTLETPAPDFVELDPEVYWHAACKAIADALSNAGAAPETVRAVGITGQAETIILTDAAGVPVRKAIVWLDNRAKEEAREIEAHFGADALFRLSGQTEMLPCWPAAKLRWLKRHEPETFASASRCLMVEDFIAFRLTGRFSTCRGLMPSTLYYDIRSGGYDPAMLEYLGIGETFLPPLFDAGECVGVTVGGSDSPLPAGVAVAAAPIDHVCGNLGSGCSGAGVVSETTGCTLAICAAFPRLVYDEERRISTYLGFAPGSYVLLPWAPTAGMLLKYFRDEFSGGLSYDELAAEAASVPPGSEGLTLLPHCAGAVSPVCNPDARGVAYGVTLAHKRGHWVRAVMESVAYLLCDNLEALRAIGAEISEIRALGGAAKSPLWLRIMADVLDLPVTTTVCDEATSLGAAILAAKSCGDFADAARAAERMVRVKERIAPGDAASRYRELFRNYRKLNELLLPTFGGEDN